MRAKYFISLSLYLKIKYRSILEKNMFFLKRVLHVLIVFMLREGFMWKSENNFGESVLPTTCISWIKFRLPRLAIGAFSQWDVLPAMFWFQIVLLFPPSLLNTTIVCLWRTEKWRWRDIHLSITDLLTIYWFAVARREWASA